MVVDVRYHLASLVATFLSLGLGILIGMSLSGDREELHRRDQWLTALEREFDQMRGREKEMAASIERLSAERDRYLAFSNELIETLITGRLEGQAIAIVSYGAFDGSLEVEGLLRSAGAEVIRRVSLNAEASATSLNQLLSLEAPESGDAGRNLATVVLTGEQGSGAGELMRASSEYVQVEALSTEAREAERVVLLLGGPVPSTSDLLLGLLRELGREGATAIALLRAEGWREVLDKASVPYITHFGSPMGKLSLLLLLSEGGMGAYGVGADLPLWPKELFQSSGSGEGVR